MQEIKFQEIRARSLEAMRQATEAFQARDADRSLDVLREYLNDLQGLRLDSAQVALLRRPVEARLQQPKTLKAQQDFEELQKGQKTVAHDRHARQALAEEQKKRQVGELMKEYNTFYKEGKYKEAEMAATKAHELDPDNIAADYGINLARIH